jgi:AAA domain
MSDFTQEIDRKYHEAKAQIAPKPSEHSEGSDSAMPNGRANQISGRRSGRVQLIPFENIKLSRKRRDLVKGLIPRAGITLVWGPPKSGKSFWTFDLFMHVVLGWSYRGRRVQQGAVVYCAFEGQAGLEARVEAFRQRFLAEDHSHIPFYLEPITLDLIQDCAELVGAIKAMLGKAKPTAVVLDTLNRSLRGSESSDEDMSAYIGAADAIRETFECAVVIIHHCGIDDSRPRGHTSLTGAVDAQLAVKRDAGNCISVRVEWMKDGGSEGESIVSRLEVVEIGADDDGEAITSCVVVPVDSSTTTTKTTARLSKATQTALRALRETVDECGAVPPASNHIPPSVRVVTVDQWRQYAYRMGVSTGEERAKQQAFKRASEHLIGGQHVGFWDGQVWLTS